jgi:hypothetical protein
MPWMPFPEKVDPVMVIWEIAPVSPVSVRPDPKWPLMNFVLLLALTFVSVRLEMD